MDRDRPVSRPAPSRWRWLSLGLILQAALLARIGTADLIEWADRNREGLGIFADTAIYWDLGRAIAEGEPYVVRQWGIPHYALRTPGYPGWIAVSQWLFGDRTLPVRLLQAGWGTLAVASLAGLVARLHRSVPPEEPTLPSAGTVPTHRLAALLACWEPYTLVATALILTEGLFGPFLMITLLGLAWLWRGSLSWPSFATVAVATGLVTGLTYLIKPSWLLFPPAALAIWIGSELAKGRLPWRSGIGSVIVLGVATLVQVPWWIRNAEVYDRFVPSALWMGASLYDGWNPGATGASDMRFLDRPEFWPLEELEQDATLRHEALTYARENPGRVVELAGIKLIRYFSPWPNAEGLDQPAVKILLGAVTIPLYGLILLGLWDRRRDVAVWVLLLGPLLYFAAIHLVFVSSVRYRIPGMMPALGLAGFGLMRLVRLAGSIRSGSSAPARLDSPQPNVPSPPPSQGCERSDDGPSLCSLGDQPRADRGDRLA